MDSASGAARRSVKTLAWNRRDARLKEITSGAVSGTGKGQIEEANGGFVDDRREIEVAGDLVYC